MGAIAILSESVREMKLNRMREREMRMMKDGH